MPALKNVLPAIALFLGAALSQTSPASAQDNTVKLSNNVPPWLAQATLVGPSDGKKQVAVAMYLQLSNVSGLESFIHDLYTPGTASYGRFLTPEQFRADY